MVKIQRCHGWKDMDGMLVMLLLYFCTFQLMLYHCLKDLFYIKYQYKPKQFSPGSPDVKNFLYQEPPEKLNSVNCKYVLSSPASSSD